MNDPYQTLNVPRDASAEEIKRAHRERAKATHPDRPGGDEEAFKAVTAAYSLLSDPDARAHYDRTGQAPQPEERLSPAEALILSALNTAVLARGDLRDVLGSLREEISRKRQAHRDNLNAAMDGEEAARAQLGRFRLRGDQGPEANLLEGAFQNLLTNALRMQEAEREAVRVHEEALDLLDEYEDTRRPTAPEEDPWCATVMEQTGFFGRRYAKGGFA